MSSRLCFRERGSLFHTKHKHAGNRTEFVP